MKKLKCESCGSPLNIVDEKSEYITCEYCGTKYKLNEKSQIEFRIDDNAKEVIKEHMNFAKSIIGPPKIVSIIIAVIVLLFIGAIAFYGTSSHRNSFEVNSFNNNFEIYNGTEYIMFVRSMLDEVSKNNKKEKEHLITIVYNEIQTTDSSKIKDLKKELVANEYEIDMDYSEKGFINKITIEDIE